MTRNPSNHKNICINIKTYESLKDAGRGGDSMNTIILKLLEQNKVKFAELIEENRSKADASR